MLTEIYNTIIRLSYFRSQWKVPEIIFPPKPGNMLKYILNILETINLLKGYKFCGAKPPYA